MNKNILKDLLKINIDLEKFIIKNINKKKVFNPYLNFLEIGLSYYSIIFLENSINSSLVTFDNCFKYDLDKEIEDKLRKIFNKNFNSLDLTQLYKKYINETFEKDIYNPRHTLIYGDVNINFRKYPEKIYDIILINDVNEYSWILNSIINLKKVVNEESLIIINNIDNIFVNKAVEKAVTMNIVKDLKKFDKYCICNYNLKLYKPKIAMYLSGHIRSWCKEIEDNILDFIKDYDVDIFISTHDTNDKSEANDNLYKIDFDNKEEIEYEKDISKEIFKNLPVKGFNIDKDTILAPEILINEKQKYSWRMWRKVYECNEMRKEYEKKSNIKYDYCIRSRFDIMILEKVFFETLPKLDDKIIIGFGSTLGYPDDMFCICNRDVMEHYADINKCLNFNSDTHTISSYTIKVYPIYMYIQIGLVRFLFNPEENKTIKKLRNDRYLNYYEKFKYNYYNNELNRHIKKI